MMSPRRAKFPMTIWGPNGTWSVRQHPGLAMIADIERLQIWDMTCPSLVEFIASPTKGSRGISFWPALRCLSKFGKCKNYERKLGYGRVAVRARIFAAIDLPLRFG